MNRNVMDNFKIGVLYILGKTRRLYFMALPENQRELKKSRVYFTIGDSATQTIVQLVGGTFLVALLSHLGISDAGIGIITSITCFLALFQLFTVGYVSKLKKYKFFVCFTTLQRIFFALMYLVPLMAIGTKGKVVLVISFYCIAQIFMQIGNPPIQEWLASIVPTKLRGRYLSIKESVAVFVTVTVMLICGVFFDFIKQVDILIGFNIMGILILTLVGINVVCFSMMKEPKTSYMNGEGKEMHGRLAKRSMHKEKLCPHMIWSELKIAFKSPRFVKVLALNFLWMACFYIACPFNASYQLKELALPYTFLMIINFGSNMIRIGCTPKLGKLADRYSMARILKYVLGSLGISFLITAFTVPANAYWMVILSSIFGALGWTFIGTGLFGVQLEFFDKDRRVIQFAVLASVSGCFGLAISLVGGGVLNYLQKNPLVFLGKTLYAQQVLNMAAFFMIMITVTYIHFVIQKEEKIATKKNIREKNLQMG